MKRILIKVAVASSLILNAAFVGGYIHAEQQAAEAKSPPATEHVFERLGLDQKQRRLFVELRSKAYGALRKLAREDETTADAYWARVLNGSTPVEDLKPYIEQSADRRVEFSLTVTALFRKFFASLTADQRKDFVDILRNRNVLAGRFIMAGRPAFLSRPKE